MGFKKYFLVLCIAFAASQLIGVQNVSATGVSPASQVFNDAVANATLSGEVIITRADASYDELILLTTRGDSGEMVSFPDGAYLPFVKGKRQIKVKFLINTGNVATGTYTGYIQASQTQLPEGITVLAGDKFSNESAEAIKMKLGNGTGNFSSSLMDLTVNVTNKLIEKWNIDGHGLQGAEAGQPISYALQFNNVGSVATKPGKSVLQIKPVTAKDYEWKDEHSFGELKLIAPFAKKSIPVDTKITLKLGTYFARVTVYDRAGKLVYDSGDFQLSVVPEGTLAQEGEFIKLNTDKDGDGKTPPTFVPGEFSTLRGIFKNTGKIGVRARFVVEIYKDGVKLDVVKSDDIFVAIGKEGEFEIPYKFGEKGEYKVIAYFTYGITKTAPREMIAYVGVPPPQVIAQKPNMLKGSVGQFAADPSMWIGLAIIAFLVSVFWFIFYRRKKPYPIGAYCLPAQQQIQNSHNNNQH